MISDEATQEDSVPRFGIDPREMDSRSDPSDPGGIDEELVCRTPFHHLRISRNNPYICLFSGFPYGGDNLFEKFKGKSFFDDQGEAEVRGNGSLHREVVDRAADSKFSDVATREEEWIDDIGIRSECNRPILVGYLGAVIKWSEERI